MAFDTESDASPAAPAGVAQVITVSEAIATPLAAAAPNTTDVAPAPGFWKFNPVTVTGVPPASGPQSGVTPKITGAFVGCGSHAPRKPSVARKFGDVTSAPLIGANAAYAANPVDAAPPPPPAKAKSSRR